MNDSFAKVFLSSLMPFFKIWWSVNIGLFNRFRKGWSDRLWSGIGSVRLQMIANQIGFKKSDLTIPKKYWYNFTITITVLFKNSAISFIGSHIEITLYLQVGWVKLAEVLYTRAGRYGIKHYHEFFCHIIQSRFPRRFFLHCEN